MSGLYRQFKTNKDKDLGGVPVTFSANEDGTIPTFFLRRMGSGNSLYDAELARITKPFATEIQKGTLSNEQSKNLTDTLFVRAIIAGWEHVQDEEGKEIKYNEANALNLITQLPLLYDELKAAATNVSKFQDEAKEAILKN